MKLKHLLALPALAIGLSALPAAAQDVENIPADYRKALMQSLRHHQGALNAVLDGGVAYEGHVARHAAALQDVATMLGDAFPEGTGGEGSRALPAIWENWDGFMERLSAIQSAARTLNEAAGSGDIAATQEAAGAFGQTCRGCHTDYRARPSGD